MGEFELEQIAKYEREIEKFRNWIFSYKDTTRLLALRVKLQFKKTFGE